MMHHGRVDATPIYAAVGTLAIAAQYVEDAVGTVFEAALGGSVERARALYDVVRGNQGQRDAITAALIDLPEIRLEWLALAKSIQSVGEARGKVVHGRISIWGGGITLRLSDDGAEVIEATHGQPEAQVAKVNRSGEPTIFGVSQIAAEVERCDRLNRDLALFVEKVRKARAAQG